MWDVSICCGMVYFFFKQKTAYEMRISDWSSDVCSSDLANLLRKNLRSFKRWREREGVSCYRVYDADLPEYAAAIDVYGEAEGEKIGRASCRERVCQYV